MAELASFAGVTAVRVAYDHVRAAIDVGFDHT